MTNLKTSDIAMVSVYFMLATLLFFAAYSIGRENRKSKKQFQALTNISRALIACLLIDALYWGLANAWRVYNGSPPLDQLNPNPWNSWWIVGVKTVLIIGVIFATRLVRRAFKSSASATYAAVVDETSDAIGVLDPDGKVYHWNPAMYKLFDYDPGEDVTGRDIRDLIMQGPDMSEERERFKTAVKRLRDDPQAPPAEEVVRRKDAKGRIKVVRVSMSRRNGPGKRFEGCFGIMKDGFDPLFPWLGENMASAVASKRNELILGQNKNCTALFADIVGFSKLVEQTPGDDLIREFIANFFREMVNIVDARRGVAVDLLGDEIFALFGILDSSEEEQRNSAANAVAAALEMHQKFREIGQTFADKVRKVSPTAPADPPRLGIGINTGRMRIGPIGSEWLSHFTAIGFEVVRAKRIEELTHNSRSPDEYPAVLISGSTMANASQSTSSVKFREVDQLHLRLTGAESERSSVRLYTLTELPQTHAEQRRNAQRPPEVPAPDVYVSYSWGNEKTPEGAEHESRVDKLCEFIKSTGRKVGRDKNYTVNGDSISAFTEELSKGRCIIAIISHEYLESHYCMIHELFSAYRRCNFKQQEFQQKVIPLVTESGRLVLHDGARFTKVADFWKKHAQTHLDENSSAEMIHRLPAMLEALQDKIQNKTFEEMVAAGFPGLSSLLPSRAGGG